MLTTSIKLFKAFISGLTAYGSKLVTLIFLNKVECKEVPVFQFVLRRAAVVNLRLLFAISTSWSLGGAGVPEPLLGSSALLQDDAGQVPPLG